MSIHRKRFNDGWNVLSVPEVVDFCTSLLGFDPREKDVYGVEIRITLRDVHVELFDRDHLSSERRYVAGLIGTEIYSHPKFIALCEAIGFKREMYTKDFSLRFVEGEQPVITQAYVMTAPKIDDDVPETTFATDKPIVVIDTTTFHNEKYKTFAVAHERGEE